MTLNWDQITSGINEGFSTVLGYYLYKNNGAGGSTYTLANTVTSKTTTTSTLTSLSPYTTYMFKISAYNIHGSSVQSSPPYSVTTLDLPS